MEKKMVARGWHIEMKKFRIPLTLMWVCAIFAIQACDSDDEIVNPFEDVVSTQDTVRFELSDPEPNSIAGIFVNIFHPTCGNVGCHDGTFEPDFRTLESSYNSLVYQIPIKNDGNYTYRVHPGNVEKSIIMARLHGTVDPPMPIQIEPDSDWAEKRLEYIENIRHWIASGARDVMGNTPPEVPHSKPQLTGVFATQGGEMLKRKGNNGALMAKNDTIPIELHLAFKHDDISVLDFEYQTISFSGVFNEFDDAEEIELNVMGSAVFERGMFGELVPYYHSITVDLEEIAGGNPQLFFRTYVKDINNPITEIPTDEGIYAIKEYMSIEF
nr:hypothetical protein [Saprospiraceae bacterium]